jgi:hypothetical protein
MLSNNVSKTVLRTETPMAVSVAASGTFVLFFTTKRRQIGICFQSGGGQNFSSARAAFRLGPILPSLPQYVFTALCLIKHRDNFISA